MSIGNKNKKTPAEDKKTNKPLKVVIVMLLLKASVFLDSRIIRFN